MVISASRGTDALVGALLVRLGLEAGGGLASRFRDADAPLDARAVRAALDGATACLLLAWKDANESEADSCAAVLARELERPILVERLDDERAAQVLSDRLFNVASHGDQARSAAAVHALERLSRHGALRAHACGALVQLSRVSRRPRARVLALAAIKRIESGIAPRPRRRSGSMLSERARAVLDVLKRRSVSGGVRPSFEVIADDAHCRKQNAIAAFRELVKGGYVAESKSGVLTFRE